MITMSKRFLCLVLPLLFVMPVQSTEQKQQIYWGTDEWANFTNKDGTGYYHELLNLIYPANAYELEVKYLPWQRVLYQLDNQTIDFSGAMPKNDKYHFSSIPVLSQPIHIVISANKADKFNVNDIKQYRGVWRRGYKKDIVDIAFPNGVVGTNANDVSTALKLLNEGRVDYYIDVEEVLNQYKIQTNSDFRIINVGHYQLFWAFSKTERGLKLKQHFDHQYQTISDSKQLGKLKQKYKIK